MTSVANGASLGRQALRRSVNERIRGTIDWSESGSIDVFCECGRIRCTDRLQLAIDEFDRVLGTPGWYVVLPGHEDDGAERPLTRAAEVVVVERGGRR
jgi:hypothetical protein